MKDIGRLVREVLEEEGLRDVERLSAIRGVWEEIVGSLPRTRAVRLEGELLKVVAGSHAWAQELHFREEELKKRILERTGIKVKRIIVKVEPEVYT